MVLRSERDGPEVKGRNFDRMRTSAPLSAVRFACHAPWAGPGRRRMASGTISACIALGFPLCSSINSTNMDTISRENNSMLPAIGVVLGAVALVAAAWSALSLSKVKTTLAAHEEKLSQIDALQTQVSALSDKTDKVKRQSEPDKPRLVRGSGAEGLHQSRRLPLIAATSRANSASCRNPALPRRPRRKGPQRPRRRRSR